MFPSLESYEQFVYTLVDQFISIKSSTLVLKRLGADKAVLEGEVHFPNQVRLRVFEAINFRKHLIRQYRYEIYRGDEQLYWYDSTPHPHVSELAATHPHHKHIPPDIKHNRAIAPGFSFEEPNLPLLIREVEEHLLA